MDPESSADMWRSLGAIYLAYMARKIVFCLYHSTASLENRFRV